MNQTSKPDLIPFSKPYLSSEESNCVQEALQSTWISDGPFRVALENEFARMHQVPFAVSVCNGTAALEMTLRTLDLSKDDEVIVPGFTFPAPYNMVLALGVKVVYADIDPHTWCIDPAAVESLITKNTRAIIAVHVYGNVSNMLALKKLADQHHLVLIEDCAQSVFSTYDGRYAGTLGDFGCFSFQATKTITTGEGGMVIASNPQTEHQLRQLRNHGMNTDRRYWHDVVGFNFRMTNLQAAMGCAQLQKSAEIMARKKNILGWYTQRLNNQTGITLQVFEASVDPIIWAFGIQIDPLVFGCSRDELMQSLSGQGIETRGGFYSPSDMPLYHALPLPVSERVSRGMVVLPGFSGLSQSQVDRICEALLQLRR